MSIYFLKNGRKGSHYFAIGDIMQQNSLKIIEQKTAALQEEYVCTLDPWAEGR